MKKIYSFLVERLPFNEEQNRYLAKVILLSPLSIPGIFVYPKLDKLSYLAANFEGFHTVQLTLTFAIYALPLGILLVSYYLHKKKKRAINPQETLVPALVTLAPLVIYVHYSFWFVYEPELLLTTSWEYRLLGIVLESGLAFLAFSVTLGILAKIWPRTFLRAFFPFACAATAIAGFELWILAY